MAAKFSSRYVYATTGSSAPAIMAGIYDDPEYGHRDITVLAARGATIYEDLHHGLTKAEVKEWRELARHVCDGRLYDHTCRIEVPLSLFMPLMDWIIEHESNFNSNWDALVEGVRGIIRHISKGEA